MIITLISLVHSGDSPITQDLVMMKDEYFTAYPDSKISFTSPCSPCILQQGSTVFYKSDSHKTKKKRLHQPRPRINLLLPSGTIRHTGSGTLSRLLHHQRQPGPKSTQRIKGLHREDREQQGHSSEKHTITIGWKCLHSTRKPGKTPSNHRLHSGISGGNMQRSNKQYKSYHS